MQRPGWSPSVDYLRATLLPMLQGLRVLTYDARNTGRAPRSPAPGSQAVDLLVGDLQVANFHDLEAMSRFQAAIVRSAIPSIAALHGFPERREPWVAAGLGKLRMPTLVVGGRWDVATPLGEAEEVAGRIPGAALVVMERSGHNPWVEQPDEFGTALRQFLDRLED